MSSLGANIVRRIIKAATYSYRKKCYADPSYCLPKTLKTTKSSLNHSVLRIHVASRQIPLACICRV